ncbi:uncharacterized protein LOC124135954 isoform X3 [Haliotis rufescens]|uniref:uncharacterized protein LOC124135954 isoform X3 n=1 Tax=Haliotis rufescens TaxID=6454 RepID=UPI00201F107E|nr:uncharacterized protein LOC124135954 isoform X3 [Haliotis rufescens]
MMGGTAFFFIAVVVNAFMVLVTATYPVVKMEQKNANDLENLLEDDYLFPVRKNMSREARQRQLNSAMWLGVTRAPPPSLTTHSIHDRPALVEINEFLLESEDEALSRDKRQTGSGDSDAVEATITLDEEFTAASANEASRTAAVESQLQSELTNNDISVDSTSATSISDVDGQTMYRLSVTFSAATDRAGLAYVLMLLRRRGRFSGFNIVVNPTVQNAASVETNAICLLCPADKPCIDGECGVPSTASGSGLFPYGYWMVDSRLRHTRWDVSSEELSIEDGFPFYSTVEEKFYIGDNGGVSFGQEYNPYFLASMGSAEVKYACIYCDDFDIRFGGDVFYHIYVAGEDDADAVLDRATAEISARTSRGGFRASWACVITWYNVPEFTTYSATASIAIRNTFQMVMVTDGEVSFIMYFYSDIQASTSFREQAVHGYKGASQFTELEYSRRETEIAGAEGFALFDKPIMSDVLGNSQGEVGVWLFQVGEIVNVSPARQCTQWYRENLPSRSFFSSRAFFLGNRRCPCRRELVQWSARFLPAPPYFGEDVYCVEMQATTSLDTFECCYDRTGSFIDSLPDAGTYNRYSKLKDPFRHQLQDSDPKDWCCRQSNLCHLYERVRPKSRCFFNVWRAILFFIFGDPHFMTLDGKVFTFNGLGEYRLIELEPTDKSFTFKLQCRTAQARSSTGEKVKATLFSAFAVEQKSDTLGTGKIHVGLNKDKTRMVIYIDEVDVTTQFYDEANFKRTSDHLIASKLNDTKAEFSFPGIGVVVTMTIISGTLSQATVLQERYRGLPKGLLGNYNGDNTDDFKSPDGAETYPDTATDDVLYPFGQSWAITVQEDSVLHYNPGQTISTFTDDTYTPLFDKDISDVDREAGIAKCGGADKKQCIFDYAVTKNEALANAATSQLEEAKAATENLANRNPTITGTRQIDAELGKAITFKFNASDEDSDTITYIAVKKPTGFTLDAATGLATWTPSGNDPVSISVAAKDTKAAQSPVLDVQVRLCKGCGNDGQCNFDTPETRPTSQNASLFQVASCKCNTGYSGLACENDKNGCITPNPCGQLRTCTDVNATEEVRTGQAYTCSACPPGYNSNNPAANAECKNINECLANDGRGDCPVNSKCEDTIGSFMCMCEKGFRKDSSGKCVDIDECDESSSDCVQTCNNIDGGWQCGCYDGYTLNADNKTCDGAPVGACATTECEQLCDNGTCKCRPGFTLDSNLKNCTDVNECDQNLCGQICNNTVGSYVCSCYTGFKLSQDKQTCLKCGFPKWGVECQSTCECQGRATSCDPARGCVCTAGWTGPRCNEDVNECQANPTICGNSQTCSNTNGSYVCMCSEGYVKNGTDCIDIDECKSTTDANVCPSNSICVNVVGSFACNCNPGYTKEGSNCTDINECSNGQDICEQSCMNVVGSYNCFCNGGYTLNDDRKTCTKDPEQTDPCAGLTNLNCSHYCEVVSGSAVCKCNRGYSLGADQMTCVDFNECDNATLNLCTDKSTCTNTPGSYKCTCTSGTNLDNDERTCVACDDSHWGVNCSSECGCAPLGTQVCNKTTGCSCKSGWTGDKCQSDINECSTATCQANSDCQNTPGSFLCQCRTGFIANGNSCDEVNECSSSTENECDHDCTNTVGSYQCSCQPGFVLEGKGTCKDIDECARGTSGCPQKCRNNLGGYACECYDGYELTPNRLNCILKPGATTCNRTDCSANGGCRVEGGTDICFCNPGYQLSDADNKTCDDIDECDVNTTCSQNCTNSPAGTYTCSCSDGFQLAADMATCGACPEGKYGSNCAQNCSCDATNTISCNATDGSCSCRTGWNGTTCTEDVPECTETPNICGTNGVCNERNGSYSCTCQPGYIRAGDACSQCTSTTFGVNCASQCTCTFANTAFCNFVDGSCTCNTGWNGTNCETNVNECSADPPACSGANETCRDTSGSFACDCEAGFQKSPDNTQCIGCQSPTYGTDCSSTCTCISANTASCNPVNGSCTCTSAWTGINCETNVDECLATPSVCTGAQEVCRDTNGSYVCDCNPGFGRPTSGAACAACNSTSYGTNCENACTCISGNSVSCNSVNGSCTCTSAWTGTNCETNVDECLATPSVCTGSQEVCRDTNGSYVCDCNPGFGRPTSGAACAACNSTSYGSNCENACTCISGNSLSCNSVNGSCTCTSAWTGINCETNVDECLATPSVCTGAQEVCRDTNGSYVCDCNPGFGRPTSGAACAACNSTSYGTNCENACTCISGNSVSCNSVNGSCTCTSAWTGTNCETNVDECLATPSVCTGSQEECRDVTGSYRCDCSTGFGRASASSPCVSVQGYSTIIILDVNYNAVINNPSSAAYTKLQEDIAKAIDAIIKAVSGTAHIMSVVGTLSTGSTEAHVYLNIDKTKTSNYDGLLAASLEKLAEIGSIDINGTAVPISKIAFGNKEITAGQSVCDVYHFIRSLSNDEHCALGSNGIPVATKLPGNSTQGYNTIVTLNANRDTILANTTIAPYFKLQQDIGNGIDSVISVVSPDTHVSTLVGSLSKGSVIAPVSLRVDVSKTDNFDGVLAAMLEKLAEVGKITIDGLVVAITKLVYNNIEITKGQSVCDVYKLLRKLASNEYCELNNGIPVTRKLPEDSVNIPLAIGLSVPLFIILVLIIAGLIYLCCLRNRKMAPRRPPSDERDDDAFRSAFVGNVPTKGDFGAARYMMYSPHTLSETASQVSDGSVKNGRRPKNVGTRDFYDTPWVNERYQGLTETSRHPGARGEPTSNFSWENLFSTLDPHRNRQFEVPRPQINSSPTKAYRDSLA